MEYTHVDLEVSDLDWFVRIGKRMIHGASAGGIIPDIVNNREYNDNIQELLLTSPKRDYKISINPFLRTILNIENKKEEIGFMLNALNISFEDPIQTYIDKLYITSFANYAKKGFWSFDKTNTDDFDNGYYHLVAWPSNFYRITQLTKIPLFHTDTSITINKNKSVDLVNIINSLKFFEKQ